MKWATLNNETLLIRPDDYSIAILNNGFVTVCLNVELKSPDFDTSPIVRQALIFNSFQ